MENQLDQVLSQPGVMRKVKEYGRRKKNPRYRADIVDGDCHQRYSAWTAAAGEDEVRITLTISIDGVRAFKSSKGQLYPVLAAINQLPPSERYKRENLILIGLAQVNGQLGYDTFLTPILSKMDD